jgi:hypothetical protein
MKLVRREWVKAAVLMVALSLLGAGCATTSSTQAQALKPTTGGDIDLSRYQTATVLPFEPVEGKKIDRSVGVKFSDDVAIRLAHDYGPLFQEVRKAPAQGKADELIVTGTIRVYRPGSKFGRAMLIGLGSAGFEGDLILKDGADNRVVFAAPFDKLWAWGGILGMSKGIEDLVNETAAAVATTVAQARGWQPPDKTAKPQ